MDARQEQLIRQALRQVRNLTEDTTAPTSKPQPPQPLDLRANPDWIWPHHNPEPPDKPNT